MELNRDQTLNLLFSINKRKAINTRYSYTTKFRWKCLGCMKELFIRYDNCSRQSIFCPSCYNRVQLKPTVAQYQYIRKLKETQLKFIETYVNTFIDSNNNNLK